jgi:hypothetical protein
MTTDESTGGRLRFTGAPGEDYQGFKSATELILDLESDEAAKLKALYKMLGTDVMIVLRAGRPAGGYATNARAWGVLDAAYGSTQSKQLAQSKLATMKQGSTPLAEFIRDYDRTCALAEITASEAKGIPFREKLVAGMAERLRNTGLTGYADLRDRAILLNDDVEKEWKRKQKDRENRQNKSTRGRGGNFDEEPRGTKEGQKRFSGDCYNCGKPGHMAQNCRSPKQQKGRKAQEETRQIDQKPVPLQITMGTDQLKEDRQD